MKIPYGNPHRQYLSIKQEIDTAIADCIANSRFIGGSDLDNFEQQLSDYIGLPSAGVASGTAAQQLSLLACDIGPGDEVIVPSMTFFSTAETVNQVGATPVFCDISLTDYCIDVDKIKSLITDHTRAIMPVDLYGQQCDYEKIKQICNHYDLYLIQDSAQSFGSKYKNNHVGHYVDLCIHSFYPAKNLDCMGDGGGVSGRKELVEKVKLLRNHGRTEKYVHQCIGWNHRMDGLQAAILNAKIKHIDHWNQLRRNNAELYNKHLAGLPMVLPQTQSHNTHVYNQYCVLVHNRNELKDFLLNKGIETGIQFPIGCHQQPAYKSEEYLPNTELVASECLSLPVYPLLSEQEHDYICSSISEYFDKK